MDGGGKWPESRDSAAEWLKSAAEWREWRQSGGRVAAEWLNTCSSERPATHHQRLRADVTKKKRDAGQRDHAWRRRSTVSPRHELTVTLALNVHEALAASGEAFS